MQNRFLPNMFSKKNFLFVTWYTAREEEEPELYIQLS